MISIELDLRAAVEDHRKIYLDRLQEDRVARFVSDIDAVKPGGKIRILTGEADPAFYNHPLILEALQRAASPREMLLQHYNRGTTRLFDRRYDEAIGDFTHCERLVRRLGLDTAFLETLSDEQRAQAEGLLGTVFNNFGYTLMQVGNIEEAITKLDESVKYNPAQAFANNNLGDCYKSLGRMEKARQHYQREIEINPTHPTAQVSFDNI